MQAVRIVAIPTEVAESVRATMRDPVHGLPAHQEVVTEPAPCRHCLRLIAPGIDAVLFTYNRFAGVESLPQPGPVFIHAQACERYQETAGFPNELRASPRTLEAYAGGRRLLAREYVNDGSMETAIEQMFDRPDVDYMLVNSTTAGCYTFRIERQTR